MRGSPVVCRLSARPSSRHSNSDLKTTPRVALLPNGIRSILILMTNAFMQGSAELPPGSRQQLRSGRTKAGYEVLRFISGFHAGLIELKINNSPWIELQRQFHPGAFVILFGPVPQQGPVLLFRQKSIQRLRTYPPIPERGS